jgi:hypothetical protein
MYPVIYILTNCFDLSSRLDIEMRRVKGTLRGLDPTLLRVKGHRDLTDPTLTRVP